MPRQYTPRVSIICTHCGTPFDVVASRTTTAKFCGAVCRYGSVSWHGESRRTPEWKAWESIKERCFNPSNKSYPSYGGRSITMCDAWRQSFAAFLADVGRRPSADHSIDRIDNNLGYAPGNVRWSTHTEQQRNRRVNHLVTFNGETRCIAEWAELTGIRANRLYTRLNDDGWSVERALTEPVGATKTPWTPTLLTFNGATHSISEWARIVGFNPMFLINRLNRGWTIERALTTPKQR